MATPMPAPVTFKLELVDQAWVAPTLYFALKIPIVVPFFLM